MLLTIQHAFAFMLNVPQSAMILEILSLLYVYVFSTTIRLHTHTLILTSIQGTCQFEENLSFCPVGCCIWFSLRTINQSISET